MSYVTEPDWTLAPEGATHFRPEDHATNPLWLKYDATAMYYKIYRTDPERIKTVESAGWKSTTHDPKFYENAIPIPGTAQAGNDVDNW